MTGVTAPRPTACLGSTRHRPRRDECRRQGNIRTPSNLPDRGIVRPRSQPTPTVTRSPSGPTSYRPVALADHGSVPDRAPSPRRRHPSRRNRPPSRLGPFAWQVGVAPARRSPPRPPLPSGRGRPGVGPRPPRPIGHGASHLPTRPRVPTGPAATPSPGPGTTATAHVANGCRIPGHLTPDSVPSAGRTWCRPAPTPDRRARIRSSRGRHRQVICRTRPRPRCPGPRRVAPVADLHGITRGQLAIAVGLPVSRPASCSRCLPAPAVRVPTTSPGATSPVPWGRSSVGSSRHPGSVPS